MKAKFFGRKIVSILLALCLVIGMIPTFALAAEEEVEVAPNADTAFLQGQIDTAAAGDGIVYLKADATLNKPLVFPAGKTITFSSWIDNEGNGRQGDGSFVLAILLKYARISLNS